MPHPLTADFPVLATLSTSEIDEAISIGGLILAFARARIKKLSSPKKQGRPTSAKICKKVIQRRGRKAEGRLHPTCTNIQLAEMAAILRDIFKCSAREGTRKVFEELRIPIDNTNIHKVAKLVSELLPRRQDMEIRQKTNSVPVTVAVDFSLFGQLTRAVSRPR